MNEIQVLRVQTSNAYTWIHKLIGTVPNEKWDVATDIMESTVSWQVGHLVISIYYHTILVITGHQKNVLEQIQLKKYGELYNYDTKPKNTIGEISPHQLKKDLSIMEQKSLDTIVSLSDEDLKSKLVSWKVEHPVAKTKFEALDWNIKHTMWHCGQLATLKRVLGQPYDFEVKKP